MYPPASSCFFLILFTIPYCLSHCSLCFILQDFPDFTSIFHTVIIISCRQMMVCGWHEFPCVGWFWGVTIGKLHQAGTVLFRCPKIRKSKYAWFRLRRSDVCVLNVPSGHIRTCAAVHGSTTLYCEQAYKDFLIFSQSHKTSPGLMRFASRKVVNHPSPENSFYNLGGA